MKRLEVNAKHIDCTDVVAKLIDLAEDIRRWAHSCKSHGQYLTEGACNKMFAPFLQLSINRKVRSHTPPPVVTEWCGNCSFAESYA